MHLTYRWQATLVIALGLLMAILDTTIVTVVLPQMQAAFHTDRPTITWVGTGYLLANAAIVPIVGYISDRIGTKTIFLVALAIFTIGSGLCAIASNEQSLIAFRVLQGIGGGALLPIAMAVIFRLFEPTERAAAVSLLMVPLLLAPAFGPTLGGYLATQFNWNAIFTVNLPIGVVAFILALVVLRGSSAEREDNGTAETSTKGFDILGLTLSMIAFTALVYAISEAASYSWSDTQVMLPLIVGGVLLIAFIIVELRVKDPVMDLRLFRNYTFTMANILIWATTAVLFGSLFLVPPFFENVRGLTALDTGKILIAQGLAMAVGLAISGRLYNTVGPRILAVAGAAFVTVSMIGFTKLTVTTTGADVQLWLILRGIGLGLVFQPLQTLAVSVVSKQQMAKASSLINSAKMVIGVLGIAILTTYLTQQTTNHATNLGVTCTQQALLQNPKIVPICLHASTMGFNDTFMISLIACAICIFLALFLGRDPAVEAAKAAKKRGEVVEIPAVPVLSE